MQKRGGFEFRTAVPILVSLGCTLQSGGHAVRDGSPSIVRWSCPQLQAARRVIGSGSVVIDMGEV
jgi:hypothetical protein